MKYLFSKARYVVFSGPHCGEGLFFIVLNFLKFVSNLMLAPFEPKLD